MAELQELLDQAVQRIQQTSAGSRFTKTPITITNYQKLLQKLADSFKGSGITPEISAPAQSKSSSGEYDLANKNISVDLGSQSNYADLANTIHHEDIHALLDKGGVDLGKIGIRPFDPQPAEGLINQITQLFSSSRPHNSLNEIAIAMEKSRRAGDPIQEAPAYAGAYSPSVTPFLSPEVKDTYLRALKSQLPEGIRKNMDRIINSYQSSKLK